MDQLFKATDPNFSVLALSGMEERHRKSVVARVCRHLNETLTREWQNFRLDDSDALQLSIEFAEENDKGGTRQYLKLEIIETDSNGHEHYFYIRDRSKGFFWFFNFVMKLEFNPKVVSQSEGTIYLLDEPGSYLHASAQSKLCAKLKALSASNKVLYCTHSHYLLDPSVIPLPSIRVAEKDGFGQVRLLPIFEHEGSISERRSAFQPVVDALQIKPFVLDLTTDAVIITEGIVDYYAFEMLKQGRNVSFLPSVGADSIIFYVSLFTAWRIQHFAIWDNDVQGRNAYEKAILHFGEEFSSTHFFLLPRKEKGGKRILQDLFAGNDISMVRSELELPKNISFDKVIAALFYSTRRSELLNMISVQTRKNFADVLDVLPLGSS